jgi:hypothetical protein
MAHPPRALLVRLARLLEPPKIDDVNDVLLSAAITPGARQLAPLAVLVDRDVDEQFEALFADAPAFRERIRVIGILRELATHDEAHGDGCRCSSQAVSIEPFARALMRLPDSFYRGLGQVLLRDVVLELDPRVGRHPTPESPRGLANGDPR